MSTKKQSKSFKLTKRMNDITGKRYNRLVAVKPLYKAKNGGVVWKFKCDCGNTKNIENSSVLNGLTKSCGCIKRENYKPHIHHRREYESTIHEYRLDKGWTVLELAEKSKVPHSLIAKLATGEVSPLYLTGKNIGKIKPHTKRLMTTLGVDVTDLFPRYYCKISDKYTEFTKNQLLYICGFSFPKNQEKEIIKKERFNILNQSINTLNEKQIEIIKLRYYQEKTLDEIGKKFKVTRERIRQIEKVCINKIKEQMRLSL